jgi:T4 RnlA family RNA ligase
MIKTYYQFLKESVMNQKYYLPTYEECVEICENNDKVVFYETKHVIDGYEVSVFNYRLASYTDFIQPIKGKNINAKELRGLTFVKNKDGSTYRRFLMLQKFWNLDQVPETLYNTVKDKKIRAITNKEDGSLITFIELPNKKIIAKTKMGFTNEQAEAADEIFNENKNIKRFVEDCMKKDYVALFEYVSFKNKIVLDYPNTELILLRVRNNKNGEYIDLTSLDKFDISVAPTEELRTLDELIELAETLTDKEGYVIEFTDGQLIKLKTRWYFLRHQLLTDKVNREDNIIEFILDETLDDVIAQLDPLMDKEKIEWINNIDLKLKKFISNAMNEVQEMVDDYTGDWIKPASENQEHMKRFALKYKKHKLFGTAISVLKGKSVYDAVKDYIKRKTVHLEGARKFLENIN